MLLRGKEKEMTKRIICVALLMLALAFVLASCGGHTHAFGEWETVKAATCDEAGSKERYCDCGEKQTEALAAVGHTYGEWETVKAATCDEAGSKERYCDCGEKQTQSISSPGHAYGKWVVTKEADCLTTGERYADCSVCGNKKTEAIPLSETHAYGEGVVTKEPTCSASGSKLFTCTVCGKTQVESVSPLGHSVDKTGKCSRCGVVTLNMTDSEIEKSKKVETMSYSVSEYSDSVTINIALKDGNSYNVEVPVYVDVRIEDDDGRVLYSKTLIKKSSQSKVEIDYDEIVDAYTDTGTLYYRVYNDYVSFDENSRELENIPWTVDVELPTLPQTIWHYSSSSCKVTNITYKVSGDYIYFYFTGEKTYDKNGNNYSDKCWIGWKLYDEDGYVVADGTCLTTSIKVGEKFKDEESTAWNVIEQGKSYRLVILNVS